MNSFKQLLNHYLISEAISLKHAKRQRLSRKYSGAYKERMNEIFDGKDRIISRINIDYTDFDSPLMKKINNLLEDNGYTIRGENHQYMKNYINGFAFKYKTFGPLSIDWKNPVKIGKLLQKFEEDGDIKVTDRVNGRKTTKTITGKPYLHEFKNDPIRASNGEFAVVISRHPYDIAGQTTDRSWTSCMDLGTPRINYPGTKDSPGMYKKYVEKDIDEGTLIAYVVTMNEVYTGPNGEEKVKLQRPLSRISIKPHNSDSGSVYSVGRMYGSQYPEFFKKIKNWISETLNNKLTGREKVYRNTALYDDAGTDTPVNFEFNSGNGIADEVMNDILNRNNDKQLGNQITFTSDISNGYVSYTMNMLFEFGKDIVKSFHELTGLRKWELKDVHSNIEKQLAKTIFNEFSDNSYRSIEPTISLNSLGSGLSVEIEFGIRVFGDEDKGIDDDYIYETLDYSLNVLSNFDYKELKRELYSICANYDWDVDAQRRSKAIQDTLEGYKTILETALSSLNNKTQAFKKLQVIAPDKLIEIGDDNMLQFDTDLSNTLNGLRSLQSVSYAYNNNIPWTIRTDEHYINTKYEIFYEWFKKNFNVDLEYYKDETENLWSLLKIIEVRNNIDNPISTDTFEYLRDIYQLQNQIITNIRNLIGYRGEIKI